MVSRFNIVEIIARDERFTGRAVSEWLSAVN
jgi:hypothetical protein